MRLSVRWMAAVSQLEELEVGRLARAGRGARQAGERLLEIRLGRFERGCGQARARDLVGEIAGQHRLQSQRGRLVDQRGHEVVQRRVHQPAGAARRQLGQRGDHRAAP